MMTMEMINTIANAIVIGMDFDSAVAVVKSFTDDYDIIAPDDVSFGVITVGNIYSYSVTITFGDDDTVDEVEVSDGDWD